jgi:hypothetical protein
VYSTPVGKVNALPKREQKEWAEHVLFFLFFFFSLPKREQKEWAEHVLFLSTI